MKIIDDVARGDWLVGRAGIWATVGGVAGTAFEAYARILHPVGARRRDLTVIGEWGRHPVVETTTWRWAQIAERTNRQMHALVQFDRLTDNGTITDFSDGWSVDQSDAGWLDPDLLGALTRHLSTTTPDDVVIGIWNGWGLSGGAESYVLIASTSGDGEASGQQERVEQTNRELAASVSPEFRSAVAHGPVLEYPGREFVLFQSSLTDLADPAWGYGAGIGWMANHRMPGAQLIWPQDQAWVIASEIDWDSTIVAGRRSLVDAIISDATFEAFEVSENDELTSGSDLINSE